MKPAPEIFENEYPRVPLAPLLMFCVYVLIWYLQIGARVHFLGAIRIELLWAIPLTILAVQQRPQFRSPAAILIIMYFLALITQIPLSQDFPTSWTVFVDRIIKFSFMALFIISFVKSPRGLVFFIGAFLLACLKMGQEGLFGVITGGLIWENQGVMRLHGSTSNYAHPNSFAGMALGTLPFIFYLFPLCPAYLKITFLIFLGLNANIILYTGSRTGYFGLLGFLIVGFLRSNKKLRLLLIGLPVIILCVSLTPPDYKERFMSSFTHQEKAGHSSEARIQILKDAYPVFLKYPFGVGVSAFPAVRTRMFGRFQDTHNLYYEVATNLGIQGFIVFFAYITTMLVLLHKMERSFKDQLLAVQEAIDNHPPDTDGRLAVVRRELLLMRAVASAVFMFLIIRLTLGLFGHDLYEIYWWFAGGLTIALYNMQDIAYDRTQEVLAPYLESEN